MEYGKQGSSETSSEGLEQDKDVKGNKPRCYECTFCKRGFTNAQALGGHMNIHRKDRAKTKQNISVSSFSEDSTASRFVTPISTQPTEDHPVVEQQRDYSTSYLQPYSSGSSGYRSQSLTTNPELLGRNLSLSFISAHLEDSQVMRRGLGNSEEVDLELRLGHG